MQKPFVQGVVLIATAIALALVSNAVASRERRLVLPGYYPNALQVPKHETIAATTTVAPPVAVTTTTQPPMSPTQTQTTETIAHPPVTTSSAAAPKPVVPATTTAAPPAVVATQKPKPAKSLSDFAPHPDKAYVEVAYDDAAALHAHGALTLDARRTSVYEQGHIAGARPFSVWESDIDQKTTKLFEERGDPREQLQPILIYCSGGDCEDSHMLAQKLWGMQFNNIYVYKDGYPDWQKHGGAIHTGSNP